jgi:hypothetical protein
MMTAVVSQSIQRRCEKETAVNQDDMDPIARWRADVDEMFARMQTPEFERVARRLFEEPIRVAIPEELRRRLKIEKDEE